MLPGLLRAPLVLPLLQDDAVNEDGATVVGDETMDMAAVMGFGGFGKQVIKKTGMEKTYQGALHCTAPLHSACWGPQLPARLCPYAGSPTNAPCLAAHVTVLVWLCAHTRVLSQVHIEVAKKKEAKRKLMESTRRETPRYMRPLVGHKRPLVACLLCFHGHHGYPLSP